MKFSLITVAYAFALLAAGMALLGAAGIWVGGSILLFWALMSGKPVGAVLLSLAALLWLALAVLMLRPAMATARPAVLRNRCLNNMKQIMLGIENYRAVHGTYPPAYSVDGDGKPLLSWRVLILPYIEQEKLFNRFKLDEPWDGPSNRKLASEMPEVYACAGVTRCRELGCREWVRRPANVADCVAIVGESTAWPPGRARASSEVTDLSSETVIVLEYTGGSTPWTAPADLSLEEALDLFECGAPRGHIHISERFFTTSYSSPTYLAGMGSAHARPFPVRIDRKSAHALLTTSGGEDLSRWELDWHGESGEVTTIIRWDRLYGAIIFLGLALLPVSRVIRKAGSSEGSPASC